jgi:Polysaccharide deacetylase
MIYTAHGIVRDLRPDLFIHRNMLDEADYIRFVANRCDKFISLADALMGRGDALTIDDSTYAAVNAANVARCHGHEVTVFVNPYHSQTGIDYFFSKLNHALDQTVLTTLEYRQGLFPIGSMVEKQDFRSYVKARYRGLSTESARLSLIDEMVQLMEVSCQTIPSHLRCAEKDELASLLASGGHVENHGWTHGELSVMNTAEIIEDFSRSTSWLKESLSVLSTHYAVPFGETAPPQSLPKVYETWFLSDSSIPVGQRSPFLFNRAPLVI